MATRPVSSKRRRRPPPEGGLEVFVADEQAAHPVDVARWSRLAERVLEAQGVHGDAELSVLFVDAEVMAGLNKRFMDEDGPTDVLVVPARRRPGRARPLARRQHHRSRPRRPPTGRRAAAAG